MHGCNGKCKLEKQNWDKEKTHLINLSSKIWAIKRRVHPSTASFCKFKKQWKNRSNQMRDYQRKELLEKGFIETSRYGGLNRASLYALTSWAVDECQGKLSIRSTNTPKSLWKKHEPEKKEKMPERFID